MHGILLDELKGTEHMSSKYDDFWSDRVEQIRQMCDEAMTRGYSRSLDLTDIMTLGNRDSWSGVAVIRGSRTIESRMAHANSLAGIWANDKTLASNKTTFRLVIDSTPSLRVFRMNWRARRVQKDGKVLSSLSIPQVAIIEDVIHPLCERFSKDTNGEFSVNELAGWLKSQFPHIQPFVGDRGMRDVSKQYPEKNIINLQDACYHLSGPQSFWIESTESGQRVQPLSRVSNMIYRVVSDWKNRIPGAVIALGDSDRVTPQTLLKKFEVAPLIPSHSKVGDESVTKRPKDDSAVDYAKQTKVNQALGLAGETFIVTIEQDKLKNAGKPELATKVHHTSVEDGDGAGYDIQSFDEEGNQIFIEVKTTTKGQQEPFFVTKNEVAVSKQLAETYWIYRVFEFSMDSNQGKLYRVSGAIDESFDLTPTIYSAKR